MKKLAALLSLALGATACVADQAEPVADAVPADTLTTMKRDVATDVAGLLADEGFQSTLAAALQAGDGSASLSDMLRSHGGWTTAEAAQTADNLLRLDQLIQYQRGIADYTDSLLEVRLVTPDGGADIDWTAIPVAYAPGGEEDEWTEIEAFDARGGRVLFDPAQRPEVPVLVAGIDAREDLRAGIAYMNDELRARGYGVDTLRPSATSTETSKLDYIRLNDDQEPWLSGKAEVYALVSGVDFDEERVQLQLVDMPYLDHKDENYYPNQILIFWENYRFAAANVQLYEHDDNTNYQSLVLALIDAVELVLDFTAPQYSLIATVAGAIVEAMPSGWFSNDDDYLDSFYTLEKGRTYTNYYGAGGNARITLTPYILQGN